MFKETENGETQYCLMCEERRKYKKLSKEILEKINWLKEEQNKFDKNSDVQFTINFTLNQIKNFEYLIEERGK